MTRTYVRKHNLSFVKYSTTVVFSNCIPKYLRMYLYGTATYVRMKLKTLPGKCVLLIKKNKNFSHLRQKCSTYLFHVPVQHVG